MTQAVRLESLDLVKVLVRRGAELYSSLLEQAFGYNESPALMEYLVREQGLGKDDPKELFTMVTYLDGPCRAKKVRLLLEGQVGLDAQYICDALAEECRVMRDPGVVATLLEQGVDVNMPAHDGWTALYSAVTIGPDHGSFLSIIRALLDRGADPNIFCDSKKRLLDKRLVDTARKQPFPCPLSPHFLPFPGDLDADVRVVAPFKIQYMSAYTTMTAS